MIRGVRKPDEVSRLGLSSRLMVRIGALLKKGVAISPVILETAKPGSPVEEALLSPALLENATDLKADALGGVLPNAAAWTLALADDGVRVLCLQEELDADEWSAPAPTVPQQITLAPAAAALATPAPQAQPHGSGEAGVFAPQELERLRLKLMTAGKADERMEALRVLCLAPIPPADKVDFLLQGLNDREAAVRSEAAGLLTIAGADRDISEALAALNHSEAHRRDAALDRLGRLIAQKAREIDVGAVAVSALAMLRNDGGGPLTGRLLDLLRTCAPQLARNGARVSELLRVVLGLVAGVARRGVTSRELEQTVNPAYKLICAIGNSTSQHVLPALHTELERSTDAVTEALILQLLLDLTPVNSENEEKILKLATGFLARDTVEGRDSRAVGSRLVRRGERSLAAICEAFSDATPAAQKYFILLMDDLWRMHSLPAALLERSAALVLQSLKTGSKPLSMAAAQCRFVTDPEISDDLRGEIAECFVNTVGEFIFAFDIEKVEQTISQLGVPALDVLLQRLSPQRPRPERVRAVRLIGNLAVELKAPKGQLARLQQGITDALRRVQALALEPDFPDRGELLCAMGKLAASPAASKEAGIVIERTLMEAARSSDLALSSRALEGLTHLAASRRAQPELVAGTSVLLRKLLDGTPFDIGTEEKRVNGETVIEISGGENYTSILPLALQGLARVACSPNCPPAITKDILGLLIACWRRVCSAEVVWGPANTALLIQGMKEIGICKSVSAEMRAELLKALVPKLMQTSIMHAVTEILAADDMAPSANNALTVGVAIFSRRGQDAQFQMEDRPEILKALARVAGRKHLGPGGAEGVEKARTFRRMVVDELFKGLRDSVPAAYESLLVLRDNGHLPTDLKEDIDKRIRELHAVVVA
ncbi:MAG TPA: hypothetical protein VEJ63_23805 [Planctomycetota bacterium]|nr:hypothetical protein [Planctomycetota bacterium]